MRKIVAGFARLASARSSLAVGLAHGLGVTPRIIGEKKIRHRRTDVMVYRVAYRTRGKTYQPNGQRECQRRTGKGR